MQITCPSCKVSYTVDKPEDKAVVCMDCGMPYLQITHSDNVIGFVRDSILRVKGEA